MDSANLHQLQDQLQLQSSSSSSSIANNSDPSCYGASSSYQWSPGGISLNSVSLSQSYNNEMLNTIEQNNTSECMSLSNIHNQSLIQQQEFPLKWPNESPYSHQESHLKIKEELSSSTTSDHQQGITKFTDMLNSPVITNYLNINGDYCSSLPSSSSSSPSSQSHRRSFSQIYPSVNISSLSESRKMNMDMSNIQRPFDMNMQVLDGRLFEANVLVSPLNSQEISRGSFPPFGFPFHQHLQQTLHHSSSSPPTHQMEMLSNETEASEVKRHNNLMKAHENASKKPRVESRSSCPPFKVRKEKLGDKIAALQQLVSPFGKTDTASVLMEAIGYIKFLQSQIETLSVPYMRASKNRLGKAPQLGSIPQEEDEEEKRDLRSRGLCLVPLSCMTYVTGDGGDGGGSTVGSGFWPIPNGFGGGT